MLSILCQDSVAWSSGFARVRSKPTYFPNFDYNFSMQIISSLKTTSLLRISLCCYGSHNQYPDYPSYLYPRKIHLLDRGASFCRFPLGTNTYALHLKIRSRSYFGVCPDHSACNNCWFMATDEERFMMYTMLCSTLVSDPFVGHVVCASSEGVFCSVGYVCIGICELTNESNIILLVETWEHENQRNQGLDNNNLHSLIWPTHL